MNSFNADGTGSGSPSAQQRSHCPARLSFDIAAAGRRSSYVVETGLNDPQLIGFSELTDNGEKSPQLRQPRNEDEYKVWLGDNFRHYFEPYHAEQGIPTQQLKTILNRDHNARHLRKGKLSRLLSEMDTNRDGRISWSEFYSKLTIIRRKDLTRSQRFVVSVIRATVPAVERHQRDSIRRHGTDQLDGGWDETDYESYLEAYNCKPPPIFIPACCLAQIICFIYYAVQLNNGPDPKNYVTWTSGNPQNSSLIFDPRQMKRAWGFISYMLLHSGYHHIVFNLLIQIALGIPLELVHKAWRVGPTFLAGVLGGSLFSAVVYHDVKLVGASGGCYAIIGAHFALVVMNWEELQKDWLKCYRSTQQEGGGAASLITFLLSGPMRLFYLLLLVALDFGIALYQQYGLNSETRTSFLAHVGGLLFGFLVGIPVLKNLDKKPWEAYLFWISLVIAVCLMLAAAMYLSIADHIGAY